MKKKCKFTQHLTIAVQFFKSVKKAWQRYKEQEKKIYQLLCIGMIFFLSACGTTKAVISKPAEGTSTTITITTNNPITTTTTPNVELKLDELWK